MSANLHLPQTISFVLAVNDQPEFDSALYRWLQRRGAVLVRAPSTQAALSHLDRYPGFDAVITSLRRSEYGCLNATAGIDLAAGMRRLGLRPPIILHAAGLTAQMRLAALSAGIGHLASTPAEVRAALARYL